MKKAQRIDLLTTIRGSIVSFVAIAMFVALGVGLFLGIHWIAGCMHAMAGAQFAAGNAHDVEITFPYGLTDKDVDAIKALDPDDLEVEASWMSFQEAMRDDRKLVFRVGTLPERIDAFTAVEGVLPQAANEIALEATMATKYGYALGDTVAFIEDGQDGTGMRYLNEDAFTVTAFVTSPAYLASGTATYGMSTVGSGSVSALSWVVPDAFRKSSYLGGRPYVLVKSARLAALDPFGDEYQAGVSELEGRVSEVGEPLGSDRMDMLHAFADLLNNDTVDELEILVASYADLVERREAGALDDAEYARELDLLGADTQEFLARFDIHLGTIDHEAVELLAGILAPLSGIFGDSTFDQLRQGLASLVDYSWIVLSRPYNGAMVLMEGYTGVTANLRWSMASLFLVVGLLVCYSAVSRLVHEQMTRIGTKKALGFYRREINALFLCYAALCVAIGIVVGVVVAVFVVETILLRAMGSRFVVETVPYANAMDVVLIGLLEMALILAATWLAASGVLKRQAVELLAGERPPSAKARFYERWSVWRSLGLLAQTTINNCVNDTRRVVGTLVGVAGCTALIACAVTLNDNVMRSFDRQYEQVTHYDSVVSVATGSAAAQEGAARLAAAGMDAAEAFQRSLTLRQPDGSISMATITVPLDDESFSRVMSVLPVDSGDATWSMDDEGVWVSEAYHEHLGANVGDTVALVDMAGNKSELPIAGFFEWHMLSHQIVMSQDAYERAFDVSARTNRLLVDSKGRGMEGVESVVRGLGGYTSTRDDYSSNRRGFTEFSRLARIVVVVYLALAAVMAACVLLNLDFMFVDEKKRELIVLMINGYDLKDAKGYIWHDSVVLTALGIICGLVLGGVVGSLTIRSIEQANSSFLHGVSWLAMGSAVLGTVVLSSAALAIALGRIKRFDLTDINRF